MRQLSSIIIFIYWTHFPKNKVKKPSAGLRSDEKHEKRCFFNFCSEVSVKTLSNEKITNSFLVRHFMYSSSESQLSCGSSQPRCLQA